MTETNSPTASGADTPLLETRGLKKYFEQSSGFVESLLGRGDMVQAVDGADLTLERNEVKGIIGESGCGKSTLLMTLIGLYEPTDGQMLYRGKDTAEFTKADWREFRSNVQMVFQDPFNSLDPKMTIEENLRQQLKIHGMNDESADERIEQTLRDVELAPARQYLGKLPKQLSGGEKQRVSIARALLVDPDILLADEPLSMLDVSTQAAVLKLLRRLREERQMSMLYISHDLSTLSHVCQDISVMYLGRIVEQAETNELLEDPKHPYTQELLNAIPVPDPRSDRVRTQLEESPPTPINIGDGCRFRERCPDRMDVCEKTPLDVEVDGTDRVVACHLYYEHEERTGGSARADPSEISHSEVAHGE